MTVSEFCLGSMRVIKVHELDLNGFAATQLLPGLDPSVLAKHGEWIDPRTYDPMTGHVFMSVHTWVVRFEGKVILIDTGAGNDKDRPTLKVLDHLHNPYLERLAAIGVQPEAVDYILLTHIHSDHVGWNTRRYGDRWLPTFPNATVICSDLEWRYGAALTAGDEESIVKVRTEAGFSLPVRIPVPGVFVDSMMPVEASGRLKRVPVDGGEVLQGIRFLSTPGHSIDHAAISITSQGTEAIFGGDVMHHPFELYEPDLVSVFCEFPEGARNSRRWLARHAAESNAVYFSSHFPFTSVGRITQTGETFGWEFADSSSHVRNQPGGLVVRERNIGELPFSQ
jgi:glyoxylase-like metal-dependent hydrolase (beta-lactamase superfamily II)